jgi:type II secretory pathway predicted ATPase ExeA
MTLACPGCGLQLSISDRQPAIEHCPRCLARRRKTVKMFSASGAGDSAARHADPVLASFAREVARNARAVRP